ncbi:MAG: exodeoxyribonuclease VII small subunit [Bacteroidia bacterium]|nr:exodeoxyribonuclease VII small subunit [Bacteroidia bacterium]
MKDFDYKKALETLEGIAKAVEDPAAGLDDIDRYVRQSEELIEKCRAYLRGVREKAEESFD